MLPDESPEVKYDRLKRRLQESILSQYPNPERQGCPGSTVLHALGAGPTDESVETDPSWDHITHCSECYREFLDLRLKFKRERKKRRQLVKGAVPVAAIVAVAFVLFFVGFYSSHKPRFLIRPQDVEVAYGRMTIDIPTMTRSENARASAPITFERKPEELTVNLPVGSKAGPYEFRLLRDDQPFVSTKADAAIRNGTTAFTLKIDFSKLASGSYSMSVRQAPWDWNYFPILVK